MNKLTIFLLSLSFIVYSCQTTDIYNLPPAEYKSREDLITDGNIIEITLNNSVINTDEYTFTYQKEYKNIPACLNLIKHDTTFIKNKNEKRYRVTDDTTKIIMSDIVSIKTELTYTDFKETSHWVIGVAAVIAVIVFLEGLLTYRIDSNK